MAKATTGKTPKKAAARKPAAKARPRARKTAAAPPGPSLESRFWTANYPPGVPATHDYPDVPLTRFLDDAARQFPNAPALDFMGNRWTYRELKELVDRFAVALRSIGVAKGTPVGFILPNLPQNVIAYYATHRLGGIVVENNPMYTERELHHQLEDSGVEVLITLDQFYAKVKAIRGELPKLREIVVTNVFDGMKGLKAMLGPKTSKGKTVLAPVAKNEPVKLWKELLKGAKGSVQQATIDPKKDLALLQYTGGTTGLSKGVMLTHHNLVTNAWQNRLWLSDIQPGKEVVICALPLFHSYGQTVCMNVGVLGAGLLVLVPNPRDIGGLLKEIDRTRPTLFPGVPTLYVNLLAHPDLKNYKLDSIRACISGAAPLPVEVQEQWERVTGGKLVEGYGLSETSPSSHANPVYGKRKIGTIGLPLPDTDCKLVDVDDPSKEIAAPGPGELVIKGPQVMQGYWNRPDETHEVLRDGWLYTGDIAEVDEDGYFKIVDRKKDMIIVGGFNVYPRDVEEVLYTNPKVLECAVVGLRSAKSGETVKAYIVLKAGESATEDEMQAFCRERLTAYKVPKAFDFRAELPKTMVGKVLRRALVEEEKKKAEAGA
ncbi:MAG TPA: long-chain fatty acid--CoA ligase [Actinomycetota bacterium]|nr:long-chain fatty acid--CoA ligase [Actinomycetota bacterium]